MESEPLNKSAEIDAAHPVIEPGHTFASVTDKISAIVLTQRTPRFWYVGFGISFLLVDGVALFHRRHATIGVGLFGASMSRWPGDSTSSILSGGSASDMRAP